MSTPKQMNALHQSNSTYPGIPDDLTVMVSQLGRSIQILRMKQLVVRTRLSRATLYALMSTDPTFPQKIKLTARTVGFLESEVDAWLTTRADCRLNVQ